MIKSVKDLLTELRVQNINLVLNGENDLEIISYKGKISSNLVQKIKEQKESIIDYLKTHKEESIPRLQLVEKSENYVVSSAQRSLWIVSQSESASIAYNMPSSNKLEGIYNVSFLEKAIESVIDRHEILRTVFKQDLAGEIKQVVLDRSELGFKIDFQDFRNEEDTRITNFIEQDSIKPFDLAKGPLLRVSLLQTSDDCYILYFNLHHIIGDGWSMEVLNKEVLSFYQAYESNINSDLPELRIQYKDYAAWEYNQFETGKMQPHKEFWLESFSGKLPVLNLPSYRVRPKLKTYNGHYLLSYIPSMEVQRFKKMVQSEGGTLFMGVVAVLKILLHKYTSERDIIIGFPIVDRTDLELKNQIGFYIKILALRNQLEVEDSFLTFFKKVKQNIFSAFKYQDYPFEKLVGDIKIARDVSRSPIFDISVTFHNITSGDDRIICDADCHKIESDSYENCKNDIEFHFQEVGDFMSFNVNYNTDVYDEQMIRRFMLNYKHLFSEIINNPNENINNINYLSGEEKRQLLLEFNNTKVDYPKDKTVIDLFENQVEKTPDAIAVVFEDRELSYKELNDLSNQLSYSLQNDYGIEKGDMVGVQLNRSEWSIISILGIMKSGGVYVPIDQELPSKRKAFMAEDTGLKLLITETSFILELDFYEGNVFSIDVEFLSSSDFQSLKRDLKTSDLAYIIYTSGSTGNPKGVMIEHLGLLNTVLSQVQLFKSYKKSLQFASFSFDASIWEVFITLLSGSSLYVINENVRKDIKLFESYIKDNNIEIATLPPAYLKLLNVDSLEGLKVLITAGESAVYDKVSEYLKFGTYYNAYGPTETSICGTMLKVEKGSKLNSLIIPIGTPISNTSIYILDNFSNLQPEGVIGEIHIGGSGLARGYLNQPELTSEKFITNPFVEGERIYKTGDLGRWLPDGNIEYHGRIDDQVKIRGYRIELGEIEELISNQDFISQSVVIVKEKEKEKEKYIVAYYVSEHDIDKKELQNSLSKVLPEYMLPSYYIQLELIPLTINGKIDRKALPNLKDEDLIKEEFVAARTKEEEILVSVLSDVLKHNQISVRDNLYNLGVHSIIIIQIVSRLKQLSYTIAIEEFLNYPVIEDLAVFIKYKSNSETQSESKEATFLIEQDFESEVVPEENNYLKEWKYGDVILLSPNQYRFFKLPHLKSILNFEMLDFSEEIFEREFRLFLLQFPILTLKYEEYNGQIFQRYISADEIKFKLLVQDASLKNYNELEQIGQSFIYESSDLLYAELIRVFVVRDKISNKAKIYVSIPYSISDGYSSNVIHNELINFFQGNKNEINHYHPFTIISHQKEFLASKKGLEERKHWIETLKKVPMTNSAINIMDCVSEPVMIQNTFISGDDFEKIEKFAVKYNLPISAILNSFFEMVLSDFNSSDKKIYGVLVDGRELEIKTFDVSKIMGVINNMMPLTYIDYSGFNIDGIIKCYSKYLNARKYQRIPYETICDDLLKVSGNELNKNVIGYFNFKIIENFKTVINSGIINTSIMDTNPSTYDICLSCDLHPNGIDVRLFTLDKIYEQKKEVLSLKKYIYKFLEIIHSQ
jgi:amino acid adenylation domain-containing protein